MRTRTLVGMVLAATLTITPMVAACGNDAAAVSPVAARPGELWLWGSLTRGEPVRPAPVGLRDVVSVAGGFTIALAATADGTAYVWGQGDHGVLADPDLEEHTVDAPRKVAGLPPVQQVAAADDTAFALARDGTVWAWGSAFRGLLGTGTDKPDTPVPTRIDGLTDVTAIAVSDSTGFALRTDGTVWAWGSGELGRGPGRSVYAAVPAPVPGLTGVTAIAAGDQVAMARTADGTAWIWGTGQYGAMGNGQEREPNYSPQPVPGVTGVVEIAAGGRAGYARTASGDLFAWGSGYGGTTGDGNAADHSVLSPRKMAEQVTRVFASQFATYTVDGSGVITVWGQAGPSSQGSRADATGTPVTVTAVPGPQIIANGGDATLVIAQG